MLADVVGVDKFLHSSAHVGGVEIAAYAVQGALDPLVAISVNGDKELLEKCQHRWYVEAA